jgi:hypothetical protein
VEAQDRELTRHLGYRMHVGSWSSAGHRLFQQYRRTVEQGIHATKQNNNQSDQKDDAEAQSSRQGGRDEHNPQPTLYVNKRAIDGGLWIHSGIRQKGG